MTSPSNSTTLDSDHLTPHAQTRAAQRGASDDALALVMNFGDIEYPAAAGRRRLRMSRRMAAELIADDFSPQAVYKAMRVELIIVRRQYS